ncbi:unnamed protein product (macronuclear) [Paramecium tetraurelia]|uniref:DUF726 domain protein n=1 Tax=Paramecium tetraurelia TaxID=5888 RepID=A0DZ74_PARTE|nr:uncharacterized protein GSPATT00003310001 [Paramecium tetraurelia]CAK88341.1 unnamed protein product [Paramecium tetraurelia]|eukprot:XP_001455738.1 hypothetical protein (macronuclear) [Paramecium tetraurelia strain d4-2]
MQQYMEEASKVIPKNLTTYFNTVVGALNIFQTMANKFYPEYMEVQNAKDFQIDDPTVYSSIYQGDPQLENNKRKSRILKTEHYKQMDKFLEKYNFDKQFNSQLIGQHFFSEAIGCCQIELQTIIGDKSGIFYEQSGILDKTKWLNQAIDEVSLILLEYFKGQFQKQQILEEYIVSFAEIQSKVYQKVNKRAKATQKDSYIKLKQKIRQYFKELHDVDVQLQTICSQIKSQNISILDSKKLIENQYQIQLASFQEHIQQNYGYALTNAIIHKYCQKLRRNYVSTVQNSFAPYLNFNQEERHKEYQSLVELNFLTYFHNNQFIQGITEQNLNSNLQYIIYSIDWIQSSGEADEALKLLDTLSGFNLNVSQSKSQIFYNQQFSVNVLANFKNHNKQRCEKALQWWNTEVDEDTNIQIICQIYIILAGITIRDNKLIFGDYEPAKRNAFSLILRQLNNGKYQYFNNILMKLCEKVTDKIQFQILNEIENRLENNKIEQLDDVMQLPFSIDLYGTQTNVSLFGQVQNQTQINFEFYKKYEYLKMIVSGKNGNNAKTQKEIQYSIIQKHFEEIKTKLMDDHNKKKNKSEESEAFMTPPSQMYFQLLSNKENNSNVITLCISGFLSGDEDKSSQWVDLLHSCSGTVIGLHWNCSETKEFFSTVAQNLVPQIFSKFNAVGVALSAVSFLTQNPYEKASKEAERVGKYLAYLIAEYKLFGNRQINIICHSLGSVIVLECIKELDKLYEKKKQQFINEIMIMGGVADIFKLQKRRWNAVAGRIYNTYSKNDQILKYVLQIAKVFDSPCGLKPIYLGYKQVVNCDFTEIVNGHSDYWNKMIKILMHSDFNNDFKFMTSSIKEIF